MFSCEQPVVSQQESDSSQHEFEKVFALGGAPVQVKVQLSKQKIELTDKLTLTIIIEYSEGSLIVPPYLSEAVYAPLLLTEKPQDEVRWSDDNQFLINQWHYQFEPRIFD